MRLACPGCQATYEVPDALIGAGRRLRCVKCGHEWLATVAAALPADHAAASSSPPPPLPGPRRPSQVIDPPLPTPAEQRAARRAKLGLWAAWIASGLVLVLAGLGAWVYRGPIAEAWPPAARVYLLLGTPPGG